MCAKTEELRMLDSKLPVAVVVFKPSATPSMTIEKRRSKVLTVVAEQELDLSHLGVALFGLVDGLRTDGGKAKRED